MVEMKNESKKKELICDYCKKKFIRTLSEIQKSQRRKAKNKFCSNECSYKFMSKPLVKKICKQCGKEYFINYAKRNKSFFCSKQCHQNYRKNRETVVCKNCNKRFKTDKYDFDRKKEFFCSRKCLYSIKKGKNHHSWRGGKSFEPYGVDFNNKLKEQIRKRDNYTCQECYYTQDELKYTLHVHHIDFNKKNNSPNNLISLCRNCHCQTNFDRQKWIDYFKQKVSLDG